MSAASSPRNGRKDSLSVCLVCCHTIDNVKRFNTVGACGHVGCCSLCALRLRQLMDSRACAICKAELPRVICIERESDTFDSFQDWGDNIGPSHVFDEPSGMFLLKRDVANVAKLRDMFCRKCGKKFTSMHALKTHMVDVHRLQYCNICLEHKKVFLDEHELFSKEALKHHAAKGNPEEGFLGHPRCDFCFSRHYSNAELYDHLHKNHYECDICVRSMGVQNRYYRDYHDLENHFRAEHFLCEEPVCLAKKFVVFRTHLDFQAHMTKEHPHIRVSKKIDVHFKVRRAIRDGVSGTGDDDEDYARAMNDAGGGGAAYGGGNGNDSNTINVADFPALTPGDTRSQTLSFWESQTTTRPRMEDFPDLASANPRRGASSAAQSNFRNALAPPPTPAMLAHMRGQDSWEYPEISPAAAVLGAGNPLMRFVKPGKMKRKKGKPPTTASGRAAAQPQSRVEQQQQADELEEKSEALEVENLSEDPHESKGAIVLKIRQALGSDAKYEVFRETCKAYRLKEMDLAAFYPKVRKMFSDEDFNTLFLQLMKLSPDATQGREFAAYHRQQQRGSDGFQQPKNQQKKANNTQSKSTTKNRKQGAQASGWANALKESGVSTARSARKPAVVINNTNRQPTPATTESPRATWSSSQSWQAPVSAAAPAVGLTPASSKIQTAEATEAVAALQISSAPAQAAPSYAAPAPRSFRNKKEDFPALPSAGKPVGVQTVTRATWDDQLQAIAQNRMQSKGNNSSTSGGKRKQKKSMTLGELAMNFS